MQAFLNDTTGAEVSGSAQTVNCDELPLAFGGLTAPGTYYLNVQGLNGTTTEYLLAQDEVSVYPATTSSYLVDVPTLGF